MKLGRKALAGVLVLACAVACTSNKGKDVPTEKVYSNQYSTLRVKVDKHGVPMLSISPNAGEPQSETMGFSVYEPESGQSRLVEAKVGAWVPLARQVSDVSVYATRGWGEPGQASTTLDVHLSSHNTRAIDGTRPSQAEVALLMSDAQPYAVASWDNLKGAEYVYTTCSGAEKTVEMTQRPLFAHESPDYRETSAFQIYILPITEKSQGLPHIVIYRDGVTEVRQLTKLKEINASLPRC